MARGGWEPGLEMWEDFNREREGMVGGMEYIAGRFLRWSGGLGLWEGIRRLRGQRDGLG